MSAGRGPADPSAKNIWCDAKDHARPRKYLEQNIFSKRGVQVEYDEGSALAPFSFELSGSATGGVVPHTITSPLEPPPPYVLTVRTATVMSASAVSAPPYGKPCLQTGQNQARQ